MFTIGPRSIGRIGKAVRRVERTPTRPTGLDRGRRHYGGSARLIPARSSGSIAPRSLDGTTISPGAGEVKLYDFVDGDLVLREATTEVFNDLGEQVPSNVLVRLYRFAGKLWVAGWECEE